MAKLLRILLQPAGLFLLALLALSGWSLWRAIDAGPAEPSQADWDTVGQRIAKELTPGDVLRVHPFWLREGGRVAASAEAQCSATRHTAANDPDHGVSEGSTPPPSGGEAPCALPVDFSVPLDPMTLYAHRRLWLVSALDRQDAPPPPGATLDLDEPFDGQLRLQRYTLGPSPVSLALGDALPQASVERFGGIPRRRCRWNGREHDCAGRPWENVRLETREVGGAPRRCFLMHPYPNGATVSVRFPAVTLGAGVLVRSGFVLESAKNEKGGDTTLTVRLGDQVVGTQVTRRNAWDFAPLYVDTEGRRGQVADLILEVSAANEEFRDLCVDGYVVTRPVPEAEGARRCPHPSKNPTPGRC